MARLERQANFEAASVDDDLDTPTGLVEIDFLRARTDQRVQFTAARSQDFDDRAHVIASLSRREQAQRGGGAGKVGAQVGSAAHRRATLEENALERHPAARARSLEVRQRPQYRDLGAFVE